MAFRRFKRFRSSGRRFSGRRTPRLRRAHDGGRWERCYFYLSTDAQIPGGLLEDGASVNFVIELASLKNMIDTTSAFSRAMVGAMRQLEIGGIVMGMHFDVLDPIFAVPEFSDEGAFTLLYSLATDQLQVSTGTDLGFPNSTDCNWNSVASPMSVAGIVGPDAQEQHFPKQIHWRDFDVLNFGLIQYETTDPAVLHVPAVQVVRTIRRTMSKRLRLRLGDQETLIFTVATCPQANSVSPGFFLRGTISGTLYYRLRF